MYAEVHSFTDLTPTLRRITLSGGTLNEFDGSKATDAYINAKFLPANSPITVPFTQEDLDAVDPSLRPKPRRFTIRDWDPSGPYLTIDFAIHGEDGYAGTWAKRAVVGDRLQFNGPGGSYRPSPSVDWHLLVGDESASGAIGASLQSLSANDKAIVFVVVDGPDHEFDLPTAAQANVHWLHRDASSDPETLLADAVANAEFLDGTFDVFVHGEASEVRAVRQHLIADRGIDASVASISPYWRRQHSDEQWRQTKRAWMAEQARDVAPRQDRQPSFA